MSRYWGFRAPLSDKKTLQPFCLAKIAVPTPLSPPPNITKRFILMGV